MRVASQPSCSIRNCYNCIYIYIYIYIYAEIRFIRLSAKFRSLCFYFAVTRIVVLFIVALKIIIAIDSNYRPYADNRTNVEHISSTFTILCLYILGRK